MIVECLRSADIGARDHGWPTVFDRDPYIDMTEKDAETYMSGKTCVISGNLDWCLMTVVRYHCGVPEEC
jgi:hypothetical protein